MVLQRIWIEKLGWYELNKYYFDMMKDHHSTSSGMWYESKTLDKNVNEQMNVVEYKSFDLC